MRIASACSYGTIRIWYLGITQGFCCNILDCGPILSLASISVGRLACSSSNGNIIVWCYTWHRRRFFILFLSQLGLLLRVIDVATVFVFKDISFSTTDSESNTKKYDSYLVQVLSNLYLLRIIIQYI